MSQSAFALNNRNNGRAFAYFTYFCSSYCNAVEPQTEITMKKHLIYLLYITFVLIFPTTLMAQSENEKTRVYGKVMDATTKKAIPYVSVRIKNGSSGGSLKRRNTAKRTILPSIWHAGSLTDERTTHL